MDVIALRRMLMTMGGGPVRIGDFTQFEKKTLTFPNAQDSSDWDKGAIVPCSFEPKLIIVYGGDDKRSGTIKYGVFSLDINGSALGVVAYRNVNGTNTYSAYAKSTNAGASRFNYANGSFFATRATNGSYWRPEDTYTFEIYG